MNVLVKSLLSLILSSSILAAAETPKNKTKHWIFFTDKQAKTLSKSAELRSQASSRISARALKRRAKVRAQENLIDHSDYSVSEFYLNELKQLGLQQVAVSNWLNAASYWLGQEDLVKVRSLAFVKEVRPVASSEFAPPPIRLAAISTDKPAISDIHLFDYGDSILQNSIINVPSVHDLGITGEGVWVGMLDTGFKFRGHEAFEKLHVIAEFDFIHNDALTENEADQDTPNQHNHGTQTLSTIAGFKEGQLIGPAFNASFLLAKTEILDQEIPAEEDYWVTGLEWLENLGVDIVSSSLGYSNFPGQSFYTPADMNGRTAVTTVAADLAVSRGVVVVNSAGNSGDDSWRIISAPADGINVIAAGAVTSAGDSVFFSSAGPSADGRIKPDVLAMGVSVKTALPSITPGNLTYAFANGTSFSAPSVAGVAALILSAHPQLTPAEVGDALRLTANRAMNPDDSSYKFGWGIVNAYEAVLFHGMAFSNSPMVSVLNQIDLEVKIKVASKFGVDSNKVSLIYANSEGNFGNAVKMNRGTENNQFSAIISGVNLQDSVEYYFSVTDSSGAHAFHPPTAPHSFFTFPADSLRRDNSSARIPATFVLEQNYPNPFNPSTTIRYNLPVISKVTVFVTNLLGQTVKSLLTDQILPPGTHEVQWDGSDNSGRFVASGVYFYHLKTDNFREVRKMLLLQ